MSERPYLERAKLYAAHGLRVFPCARIVRDDTGSWQCSCWRSAECGAPGKHAVKPGWRDHATTEGGPIYRWWGMGGLHNIGIATGAASGIVVVDIDPRHGGDETLADLEREHGQLPLTWRFLTGGGGEHIIFEHPGGFVTNSNEVLGPGIDTRGDGGLIIAPPSLHISGRRYEISRDHHPDDTPLAPLPEWLLGRLRAAHERQQRHEKPVRPSNGLSRYGEAALANACRRIAAASEGHQEKTLNSEAYAIGRLAGAGAVPADFGLRVLRHAAEKVSSYDAHRPWRAAELDRKVERAFSDGVRNPRRVRR